MAKEPENRTDTPASTGKKSADLSAEEIAEGARLLRDRTEGQDFQANKQDNKIIFGGNILGFAKREPVVFVLSALIILLTGAWFIFFN